MLSNSEFKKEKDKHHVLPEMETSCWLSARIPDFG